MFAMLPKGGNLFSRHNWRPVAVLKVIYFFRTRLEAIKATIGETSA